MEFIACQNLAGSFSLAGVQVGLTMKHVVSLEGFGVPNVEANRHIMGDNWIHEQSGDWRDWSPMQAPLLTGTPPCSGFSLMNRNNTGKGNVRGPNSPINDCMWALQKYAARCTGSDGKPGPEIVSFESVQQAGKQGLELMRMLRDAMSEETGQEYTLTHMFLSGSSTGSAQTRKRYYFVVHRIPFGIEGPLDMLPYGDESPLTRVATYADAIDDLRGLEQTWDEQPIKRDPTWWSAKLRHGPEPYLDIVDAHVAASNPHAQRLEVIAQSDTGWQSGEPFISALLRHVDQYGSLPEPWKSPEELNFARLQWGGPVRIFPDKPGYVITGTGGAQFMHYAEERLLTVRECARLMGFPDSWTWTAAKNVTQGYTWVGKQMPVQSAMFMTGWFKKAIEGNPGSYSGEQSGENEYIIDITHDYKAIFDDKTRTHGVDSRNKDLKEAMAKRGTRKAESEAA